MIGMRLETSLEVPSLSSRNNSNRKRLHRDGGHLWVKVDPRDAAEASLPYRFLRAPAGPTHGNLYAAQSTQLGRCLLVTLKPAQGSGHPLQ